MTAPQLGRSAVAATILLALAATGHAAVRAHAPDLLPPAWAGPGAGLRRAAAHEAAGRHAEGAVAALEALEAAPWYGPGWALAAAAVTGWLGRAAALPYARTALWLDPSGRSTIRTTGPMLAAAGVLSVTETTELLTRTTIRELATALPVTPPADWPSAMRRDLTAGAAEALLLAGRLEWLQAYAAHPRALRLDAGARTWVLRAECADAARCLAAVSSCEAKDASCPRGVVVDRALALGAARGALESGRSELAASWARRVLALRPAAVEVEAAAQILGAAGRTEEAAWLRRAHPAMAGRP